VLHDGGAVVGEELGGVAVGPASLVLQGLWQVPVVQRRQGGDAGRQEFIDQPAVEIEALLVDLSFASGKMRGQAMLKR